MVKETERNEIPAEKECTMGASENCEDDDLPFGPTCKKVAEFQIEGTGFICSQYEDGTQTVCDPNEHRSSQFDAWHDMAAMRLWVKGYESGYKDGYDRGRYDNEWELHQTLGLSHFVAKSTLRNLFTLKPGNNMVKIIVAKNFQGAWDFQIVAAESEAEYEVRLQSLRDDDFRKVLADRPTEMFDVSLWDYMKEFEGLLELSDDTGLPLYILSEYPTIEISKYFRASEVFSFELPQEVEKTGLAADTSTETTE